jgi:hypothetical protein
MQPPPAGDNAWVPTRLEYQFAASAPEPDGTEKVYTADEFYQDRLDRYSLDPDASIAALDPVPQSGVTGLPPQITLAMIPIPVSFAGMPNTRWWTFEDNRTNFGDIDASTTDLANDTRPGRRRSLCGTRPAGRGQPVLFLAARPPQLSRAGYHPGDPRWAAAARFDGREAPRALTSATCLARSEGHVRLCLSPIRIQRSTVPEIQRRPDFVGTSLAFSPPTSAALRYWNMARQRYCPVGAIWKALRVSADPVAKPAAHTRAESRGSGPSKADAAERQTLRWRKTASNCRSPPKTEAFLNRLLPPSSRQNQSKQRYSTREGPLQREEAKNRLAAIAPLADALTSLGSPGPAPHGLGSTGDSVFNSPTSILGAPAVTVPMLGIEGMPVGIQIVGQRHADARTAGIARWLFETVKPVSVYSA